MSNYYYNAGYRDFSDLVGKTIVKIDGSEGDGQITFYLDDGSRYEMYHEQDCCESVYVESIVGDWDDLLNTPIVIAEGVSNADGPEVDEESYTYTFYKLATNKGYVDIRWLGSSNGYYSESVDFKYIPKK